MDTYSEQQLQQIREKAQAIAARIKSDPEYRQRMKADPAKMLAEEGIPTSIIAELLHKDMGDEVSGYLSRQPVCCVTCMETNSCHLTL